MPDIPQKESIKENLSKLMKAKEIDSYFKIDCRQAKHVAIKFVPKHFSFDMSVFLLQMQLRLGRKTDK